MDPKLERRFPELAVNDPDVAGLRENRSDSAIDNEGQTIKYEIERSAVNLKVNGHGCTRS